MKMKTTSKGIFRKALSCFASFALAATLVPAAAIPAIALPEDVQSTESTSDVAKPELVTGDYRLSPASGAEDGGAEASEGDAPEGGMPEGASGSEEAAGSDGAGEDAAGGGAPESSSGQASGDTIHKDAPLVSGGSQDEGATEGADAAAEGEASEEEQPERLQATLVLGEEASVFSFGGLVYATTAPGEAAWIGVSPGSDASDVVVPSEVGVGGETYSVTSIGVPEQARAAAESALAGDASPEARAAALQEAVASSSSFPHVRSLSVPATVEDVEPAALAAYPNLETIEVAPGSESLAAERGLLLSADMTRLIAVAPGMTGRATIPASVEEVAPMAFARASAITRIAVDGRDVAPSEGMALPAVGAPGAAEAEAPNLPAGSYASASGLLYKVREDGSLALVAAPGGIGQSVTLAPGTSRLLEGSLWALPGLKSVITTDEVNDIALSERRTATAMDIADSDGGQGATSGTMDATVRTDNLWVHASALAEGCAPAVYGPWTDAWAAAGALEGEGEAPARATEATAGDVRLALDASGTGLAASLSPEAAGRMPVYVSVPASAELGGVSYPVTSIAAGGFQNAFGLAIVDIPDSVSDIGVAAFAGCSDLLTVNLGAGVERVGARAFEGTSLLSLELPPSVSHIGAQALSGLDGTKILAHSGVSGIESAALGSSSGIEISCEASSASMWHDCLGLPAQNNSIAVYAANPGIGMRSAKVGQQVSAMPDGAQLLSDGDLAVEWSYKAKSLSVNSDSDDPANSTAIAYAPGKWAVTARIVWSAPKASTAIERASVALGAAPDDAAGDVDSSEAGSAPNTPAVSIPTTVTEVECAGATWVIDAQGQMYAQIAAPKFGLDGEDVLAGVDEVSVPIEEAADEIWTPEGDAFVYEYPSPDEGWAAVLGVAEDEGEKRMLTLIFPEGSTDIYEAMAFWGARIEIPGGSYMRASRWDARIIAVDGELLETLSQFAFPPDGEDRGIMALAAASSSSDKPIGYSVDGKVAFYMNKDNVTLSAGAGPDAAGEIIVPGTFNGREVTTIKGCELINSVGPGFANNDKITKITIEEGITTIERYGINKLENLEAVSFPASLGKIDELFTWDEGGQAVFLCHVPNLKRIEVSSLNEVYCSDKDGVMYSKDMTQLVRYPGGSPAQTYRIPNTITSIASDAIYRADNLRTIIISDGITQLGVAEDGSRGAGEIARCANLETIVLGTKLKSITSAWFSYQCPALKTFYIKGTIDAIEGFGGGGTPALSQIEAYLLSDQSSSHIGNLTTAGFIESNLKKDYGADIYKVTQTGSTVEKYGQSWPTGTLEKKDGATYSEIMFIPGMINGVMITELPDSIPEGTGATDETCTGVFYNVGAPVKYVIVCENITTIDQYSIYWQSGSWPGAPKYVCLPSTVSSIHFGSDYVGSGSWPGFLGYGGAVEWVDVVPPDNGQGFYSSKDGLLYNGAKSILHKYPSAKPDTEYIMPDSVTNVGRRCFLACSNLETIVFSDNIVAFDSVNFLSASPNLKNVTFGSKTSAVTSDQPFYYLNNNSYSPVNFYIKGTFTAEGCFPRIAHGDESKAKITVYLINDQSAAHVKVWQDAGFTVKTDYGDNIFIFTSDGSGGLLAALRHPDHVGAVTVPSSFNGQKVTGLAFRAFNGCNNVTSVTFAEGIKTIPSDALQNMENLEMVKLPSTVRKGDIGFGSHGSYDDLGGSSYAGFLAGCLNVQRIEVDVGNPDFKSVNGVMYSNDGDATGGTVLYYYPAGLKTPTYVMPSVVQTYGDRALTRNPYIKSLTLSPSITKMDAAAGDMFGSVLPNLETITIPASVTDLSGYGLFYGCSKVTKIIVQGIIQNGRCFTYADDVSNLFSCFKYCDRSNIEVVFQSDGNVNSTSGHLKTWTDAGFTQVNASGLSYVVRFESNGGPAVASKSIGWNQESSSFVWTVAAPDVPKRAGYAFDGWHIDSACTKDWSASMSLEGMWDENGVVTLYASWISRGVTIKVHHFTENLTGTYDEVVEDIEVTRDTWIKLGEEPPAKVMDGFDLRIPKEGNPPQNESGQVNINSSSQIVTYYYDRKSYDLTVAAKGSTVTSVKVGGTVQDVSGGVATGCTLNVKYDQSVELNAASFDHYTWKRWESNNTSLVSNGAEGTTDYTFKMGAGAVTLTATSTADEYSISYDLDGGEWADGANHPASYNVETETFTLGALKDRFGYTFTGWEIKDDSGASIGDSSGNNAIVTQGSYGNRHYKAVWEPFKVKVRFDGIHSRAMGNDECVPQHLDDYYVWVYDLPGETADNTNGASGEGISRQNYYSFATYDYGDLINPQCDNPVNSSSRYAKYDGYTFNGWSWEWKGIDKTSVDFPVGVPTALTPSESQLTKYDVENKSMELTLYGSWSGNDANVHVKVMGQNLENDNFDVDLAEYTTKMKAGTPFRVYAPGEDVFPHDKKSFEGFCVYWGKPIGLNLDYIYADPDTRVSLAWGGVLWDDGAGYTVADVSGKGDTWYGVSLHRLRYNVTVEQPSTGLTSDGVVARNASVDGSSAAQSLTSIKYGSTIELKANVLDGYRVKSWSVKGATTGNEISVTAGTDANTATFTLPNESVTVTPEIEELTYSVTLDPDSGAFDDTTGWSQVDGGLFAREYTVTSNAFSLIKPSRWGYRFDGWGLKTVGDNGSVAYPNQGKDVVIATGSFGDREYKAIWTPYTINVTFVPYVYVGNPGSEGRKYWMDPTGGSGMSEVDASTMPTTVSYSFGEEIDPHNVNDDGASVYLSRPLMNFKGWSYELEGLAAVPAYYEKGTPKAFEPSKELFDESSYKKWTRTVDHENATMNIPLFAVWEPQDSSVKLEIYRQKADGSGYDGPETKDVKEKVGIWIDPRDVGNRYSSYFETEGYTYDRCGTGDWGFWSSVSVKDGTNQTLFFVRPDGQGVIRVYLDRDTNDLSVALGDHIDTSKSSVTLGGYGSVGVAEGTRVITLDKVRQGATGTITAALDDGYTFDGWAPANKVDSSSTASTTFTMPNENVALSAKARAKTYTVSFDKVLDSAQLLGVNSIAATWDGNANGWIVPGALYSAAGAGSQNPAAAGYEFMGWSTSKVTPSKDVTAADAQFLPGEVWGKTSGNSNSAGANKVNPVEKYDGNVTEPDSAGSNDGMITLYAVWKAHTYTISLDVNNGDPLDQASFNHCYGASETALPAPTRDGYEFVGWVDNASNSTDGAAINKTVGKTEISVDTTYRAIWKQRTFTVSFADGGDDANGHGKLLDSVTVGNDGVLDASQAQALFGTASSAKTVDGGKTIVVSYKYSDGKPMAFESESDAAYTEGAAKVPAIVDVFARTGFAPSADGWDGWSKAAGGIAQADLTELWHQSAEYAKLTDPASTTAKTITARWTANTTTVAYYDAKGWIDVSSIDAKFKTYSYDADLALPGGFTHKGWMFKGWYETTDGSVLGNGPIDKIAKHQTAPCVKYLAKWEAHTYDVSFDVDEGEVVDGVVDAEGGTLTGTIGALSATWTYDSESTMPAANVAIAKGYELMGWSDMETFDWVAYNAASDKTAWLATANNGDPARFFEAGASGTWNLSADKPLVVLHAVWRERAYEVSFDLNGAPGVNSSAVNAAYSSAITLPDDPTWTGFVFDGWYVDGAEDKLYKKAASAPAPRALGADNDSSKIELLAKWTPVDIVVRYNGDGGMIIDGSSSSVGTAADGTKFVSQTVSFMPGENEMLANGFSLFTHGAAYAANGKWYTATSNGGDAYWWPDGTTEGRGAITYAAPVTASMEPEAQAAAIEDASESITTLQLLEIFGAQAAGNVKDAYLYCGWESVISIDLPVGNVSMKFNVTNAEATDSPMPIKTASTIDANLYVKLAGVTSGSSDAHVKDGKTNAEWLFADNEKLDSTLGVEVQYLGDSDETLVSMPLFGPASTDEGKLVCATKVTGSLTDAYDKSNEAVYVKDDDSETSYQTLVDGKVHLDVMRQGPDAVKWQKDIDEWIKRFGVGHDENGNEAGYQAQPAEFFRLVWTIVPTV